MHASVPVYGDTCCSQFTRYEYALLLTRKRNLVDSVCLLLMLLYSFADFFPNWDFSRIFSNSHWSHRDATELAAMGGGEGGQCPILCAYEPKKMSMRFTWARSAAKMLNCLYIVV